MKESLNRHFTIIFDEFQALYKINPAIFSEMQDLWDRYHREWNRKGGNEIDMIAVNEFGQKGVVAEIKRNPNRINLAELQKKVDALPQQSFGDYALSLCGLSLEDM